MSKLSKQDILDAIRRTAKENGGVPLGRGTFLKETGISEYTYTKFWSTFGEAQREAGFVANTLQVPHREDFLLESVACLIQELGKFPTRADLIVERNKNSEFPSPGSVARLGNKREFAVKISEYAKLKAYDNVVEICKSVLGTSDVKDTDGSESPLLGEVYLFKSGRYYKIGKTNNTVRRGSEIRIQLPERMDLIHSIKTDDPNGIEIYWHRRFESKRMNGEWFDLSASDVKAFKRWKRIV